MEKYKIKKQLQISKIIANSILGKITDQENSILKNWLDEGGDNIKLYEKLCSEKELEKYASAHETIDFEKAKSRIKSSYVKKRKSKTRILLVKYAAAVMLLFGLFQLLPLNNETNEVVPTALKINKEDIVLQMENGDFKIINIHGEEKVIDENGTVLGQQNGASLVYEKNSSIENLVYNTLHIPYGTKFNIVLSDGTLVHLNSGSSMRYPVKFVKGQERKVFIKGEAYFEVTEDKSTPFVVNTNQVNIRVLGTKFNVSAYEEDETVNTVLVEGAVRLYDVKSMYDLKKSIALEPGYMASLNKQDKKISLGEVDTRIHTAWTKGRLVFKNTPFKSIRKKLERNYNVKIINNNKLLDEKQYNATFDLETIEQVLNSFNENYAIEYSIVNNQIIIN